MPNKFPFDMPNLWFYSPLLRLNNFAQILSYPCFFAYVQTNNVYSIIPNNALALFRVGNFLARLFLAPNFPASSKPIATVGGRGHSCRQSFDICTRTVTSQLLLLVVVALPCNLIGGKKKKRAFLNM